MNRTSPHWSIVSRGAAALWAASLLFFLAYSAPHQVHHFFDQFPQTHQHDSDHERPPAGHHDRPSTDSNCVFQAAASRCYVGLAWQVIPAWLPTLVRPFTVFQAIGNVANFRPDAFHIRAPPLA
jgi:hypothetical protein